MNVKKVFYFDVETTGFDCKKNDITQLAGIIEIDGKIKEEFNIRSQPINWDDISDDALEVTGVGIEELKKLPTAKQAYDQLIQILGEYCDKYDKSDKFYFAGYNVRFDIDFLHQFFVKQGDKYFGSWFNWKSIDPFPLLHYMEYKGLISLENYKLKTVCEHFDIKLKAHDAMSDVLATRKIMDRVDELLKKI